jgi:hypothetical protein
MELQPAAGTGIADLLVGLVLGLCIGLLVAPAFRAWQARREWIEASREAHLTDRLLRRLEDEPTADDTGPAPGSRTVDPVGATVATPRREAWRTPR